MDLLLAENIKFSTEVLSRIVFTVNDLASGYTAGIYGSIGNIIILVLLQIKDKGFYG